MDTSFLNMIKIPEDHRVIAFVRVDTGDTRVFPFPNETGVSVTTPSRTLQEIEESLKALIARNMTFNTSDVVYDDIISKALCSESSLLFSPSRSVAILYSLTDLSVYISGVYDVKTHQKIELEDLCK